MGSWQIVTKKLFSEEVKVKKLKTVKNSSLIFAKKNSILDFSHGAYRSLFYIKFKAIDFCTIHILFVYQAAASKILKLTLVFSLSRFPKCPKKSGQTLTISRTKRAFKIKYKAYFILKGFHWSKIINLFWKARVQI